LVDVELGILEYGGVVVGTLQNLVNLLLIVSVAPCSVFRYHACSLLPLEKAQQFVLELVALLVSHSIALSI